MKFLGLESLEYFLGKLKGLFATKSQGAKADTAVQSVKIGETEYKTGTDVVLPEYPTTLPASDVAAWAKEAEKPTYTADEVDAYSKNEIDAMELVSVDDINNLSAELTQAEYDALVEAGTVDPETVYYITDVDGGSGSGGASNAEDVAYDNSASGLTAINVQGAVDEIDSTVDELNKNMGNCTFSVQSDGAYVTYVPTGGADPVSKKLGSGSGTLTINFTFKTAMNKNDGSNPNDNTGTITVKITDGEITSQSITGSGIGITVGASSTAGICTISDFSITSISWKPE